MYKVLDLFSGAGGLSLGFEQTGEFKVTVAAEKQRDALLTFKRNHKDTVLVEDILDVNNFEEFKQEYGEFDVIIGGPPCQGFSNANRQKQDLISGNNNLMKKFIEFIENLKPMAFVMENVPMVRSNTHCFYISKSDNIEQLKKHLQKDEICLYKGKVPYPELLIEISSLESLQYVTVNEVAYKELKLLNSKVSKININEFIDEKRSQYSEIINCLNRSMKIKNLSELYLEYLKESIEAFNNFINKGVRSNEVILKMNNFIMLQTYINMIKELRDNEIILGDFKLCEDGMYIEVSSITVINYLKAKLDEHYTIDYKVLNAVGFGVPQARERFIAIGINNGIVEETGVTPSFPDYTFELGSYRSVADAIQDLEDVPTQYEISELPVKVVSTIDNKSPLKQLKNSKVIYNHIITRTREISLKRFRTLKPGQNFHNLHPDLIGDSYSNPQRTQNSLYRRLEYNKPSPTVTNVRKSMWIHPTLDRALSIREAARLQTFPDTFIFEGTKDSQYQQIGNAVPPMMAKAIAMELFNSLLPMKTSTHKK